MGRAKRHSFEELNNVLEYFPESGKIVWRRTVCSTAIKNSEAGSIDKQGHRHICYQGRFYQAHRVAWLLYYGEWPEDDIDHINRVRDDNRISNLRQATRSENNHNKPAKGYYKHRHGGYQAQLKNKGKWVNLGLHETENGASEAYQNAKREYLP